MIPKATSFSFIARAAARFALAAAAAGTAATAVAAPGDYVAIAGDKSARQLLNRLASKNGRKIRWEASRDYTIGDAEAINRAAGLAQAADLSDAAARVVGLLNRNRPEDPPLHSCAYSSGNPALIVTPQDMPCRRR